MGWAREIILCALIHYDLFVRSLRSKPCTYSCCLSSREAIGKA